MKHSELAKITRDAKVGTFVYGDHIRVNKMHPYRWDVADCRGSESGTISMDTILTNQQYIFCPWAARWTEPQLREIVAVLEKLNEVVKWN